MQKMKPLKSSSTHSPDQPTERSSPPQPPAASAASASSAAAAAQQQLSRYESQKRRDWHTFAQYLENHKPPLSLAHCSGAHAIEFLRYLDQFGKTKIHVTSCAFYGQPCPPGPCGCPLLQAWGSLDALIGRLRAAFEEYSGGLPDANPFADRAVRIYLRHVRDSQAKARGIPYQKKKRRHPSAAGESSSAQGLVTVDKSSAGGEEVRRSSSASE